MNDNVKDEEMIKKQLKLRHDKHIEGLVGLVIGIVYSIIMIAHYDVFAVGGLLMCGGLVLMFGVLFLFRFGYNIYKNPFLLNFLLTYILAVSLLIVFLLFNLFNFR